MDDIDNEILDYFDNLLTYEEDDLEKIFESCCAKAYLLWSEYYRKKLGGRTLISLDYNLIKKETHSLIKSHLGSKN